MKKTHLIAYPIAVMLAFGAGSSTGDTTITPTAVPATVTMPPVTTTVTAPAKPPATVTVTKTVTPKAAKPDDSELAKIAMQMTWDDMTKSERSQICEGWTMADGGLKDYFLGIFMESSSNQFAERDVRKFFDAKCG